MAAVAEPEVFFMARGGEGQIAGNAKGGCSVLVVSGRPGVIRKM